MKFVLIILGVLSATASQSQSRLDLEKIALKADVKPLVKGKKIKENPLDMYTSLPSIYTEDVTTYKFGKYAFSKGGENGPDDDERNSVSFLLYDQVSKKMAGMNLKVKKTSESKTLFSYLKTHYGTPQVIKEPQKPNAQGQVRGNAVYLWKNGIGKKAILLIAQGEERNKKFVYNSNLYVLDPAVKLKSPHVNETVLSYLLKGL